MAELYGNFTKSLDPKGRLAIPVKHRNAFPEDQRDVVYITRGTDKCLKAYYANEWQAFVDWIVNMGQDSPIDKDVLVREFIGRASKSVFDKQGRVTIRSDLIEYAGLVDVNEVIVVGCYDNLEIWNVETYKSKQPDADKAIKRLLGRRKKESVSA